MKRKVPLWLWQLWQDKRRRPAAAITVAKTAQFYATLSPDSLLRGLGEGEPKAARSAAIAALERLKGSRNNI